MEVYFPIAEVSQNLFVIFGLGGAIGFLSGLLGIGGGFLLTPLLIQIGIPPPVAVASAANQVTGASVSGCLTHWQRGNIDMKMGMILLVGGIVGSTLGVMIFGLLRSLGQIDLVISLCYVILLGAMGSLMLIDGVKLMLKNRGGAAAKPGRGVKRHGWMRGLPHKQRFPKSRLYISAWVPAGVGFVIGILSALMGVGGGFMMVPAMIYLIGMPTGVVVGTSLFQVMIVSANVTFLQAVTNQTVDLPLALLLLVGGTTGAQFGSRLGGKLRTEQLRLLLAVVILFMSGKVFLDLTVPPIDEYTVIIAPSE